MVSYPDPAYIMLDDDFNNEAELKKQLDYICPCCGRTEVT